MSELRVAVGSVYQGGLLTILRTGVKQSITLRPLPSTALQFCLYSHSLLR